MNKSTAQMDKWEARRIFAQARIAAAQRVTEKGTAFCDQPSEEAWVEFLTAVADIARLEASPLGQEALREAGGVALE